ncbi:ABC transporter permease [Paracoccus aminophilus]|uniref:Ferric transport system, permease protein n=1 Tax=Paracoccus aminophilus JCM 7686 TaxID=1367847 RepID=S5Z116_PARAH|nr:iron ABC transporter permease [Paracoccus aminophilus]AGT11116.1 ferric transport system, permease protein [Paracoccus aminophilus JCM 7686]
MTTPLPSLSDPARPARRPRSLWFYASLLIAALVAAPLGALIWQAAQGSDGLWSHLLAYVLPHALGQTAMLMLGVGVLVSMLGTGAAWLVTAYDFRGRRVLEWALLLPLAVPTYIVAYAYLDLLHPLGPVQSAIRTLLGYDSPRQFRLPDIRSMTGAIILLSLVLYPYVYLPTRAMFLTQAANLVEAARTLGTPRRKIFWRIAVPLARPAIAVGVSLALMETLNDIGASEFLGVRSLTISIYTTWVTRSDLPGAAQISLAMIVLVVALVSLERWARRRQRYSTSAQRARSFAPKRLTGRAQWAAFGLGALPVLFGFLIPAGFLAVEAWHRFRFAGLSDRLLTEARNTLAISAVATAGVLICGLIIAYTARAFPGRAMPLIQRVASLGYAMPGTVLALGVLISAASLDRLIDRSAQEWFGVSTGLVLIGTGLALGYAYLLRFLAISVGSIEAGLTRVPQSYDHAARTLGRGLTGTFRDIHLPLSKAAMAAAGLLVFVDCMKELSATLLLRPLNFETLATHLYGEAARGTYEEASLAALAIVAVGILPVILLARIGRKDADR